MLPEYDGVDSGDDDLLNRILWFAEKGNTPYPAKLAGIKSNDDDDKCNPHQGERNINERINKAYRNN